MKTLFKGLCTLLACISANVYSMQRAPQVLKAGKSLYEYSMKKLAQQGFDSETAHTLLNNKHALTPDIAKLQPQIAKICKHFHSGLAQQQKRLGISDDLIRAHAEFKKHNLSLKLAQSEGYAHFLNAYQPGEYRAAVLPFLKELSAESFFRRDGDIDPQIIRNAHTGSLSGFVQLVKKSAEKQLKPNFVISNYSRLTHSELSPLRKGFVEQQINQVKKEQEYQGYITQLKATLNENRTQKEDRFAIGDQIKAKLRLMKAALATIAGITLYKSL